MATTKKKVLCTDGIKLYYEFYDNSKPVLVLLHGFAMGLDSWKHQIDHFKKDYSILAFDMRGHGKSDAPKDKKYYGLERFLDDINTITGDVGVKKFYLMGFSLGGSIALMYAQRYPNKVEKLVGINPIFGQDYIGASFFTNLSLALKTPRAMIGWMFDDTPIWDYSSPLDTYGKAFLATKKHVVENALGLLRSYKPGSFDLNGTEHIVVRSRTDDIITSDPPKGLNVKFMEEGDHYVIAHKPREVNGMVGEFLSL